MHVEIIDDPHKMVKAFGEVDISNVAELNTALQKVADVSPSGFILDISGIDYIDSAGIQAVISAYKQLCLTEGILVIVNNNKAIERLISIVNLDKLPNLFISDDMSYANNLLNKN
ncbi:MAG: STAS domain-containing protein [Armatimonadota bacterium]